MADTISKVEVSGFRDRWNIQINDYKLNGVTTDFQDLMIDISLNRATAVEGEVSPLSVRMKNRNVELQNLGSALAEVSKKQAEFDSDDDGDDVMSGWFSTQTSSIISKYCGSGFINNWSGSQCDAQKAQIEGIVSKLKSVIDGLNNDAQRDMTRLQSLVDRRDESFSTATTLMTNVSETRDNAIRNM